MDGVGPSVSDDLLEVSAEVIDRAPVEPQGMAITIGDPCQLRQLIGEFLPKIRRQALGPRAGHTHP